MNFYEGLKQENDERGVLSLQERLVFDALSLHDYKEHRAKRGLPPLTKWQEECLSAERIAAAVFGEATKGPNL